VKVVRPAVALIVWAVATEPLSGQDIEMTAQVARVPLPQAYFDQVARRPDFFEIPGGWTRRVERTRSAGQAVAGTLPMVVVLALFADSPEPVHSAGDVQRALFDGPTPNGTLTEFYAEASGGLLAVQGRVLPWVRTGLTLAETVGSNFGLSGTQTGVYLTMALELVDPSTDFGQFDNDGPDGMPNSGDDDGIADAVAFEFTEPAASCPGPGIWPHRSSIAAWTGEPFATNDPRPNGEPVLVNGYIIQSTVDCSGTGIQNAATIAHELGHVLGLPDLYDSTEGLLPEERRWVVGCWSLMAAGAWGCGGTLDRTAVRRPPHFAPWEKVRLGWLPNLEVVAGTRDSTILLQPARTTGHTLRVPLSTSEYLLVEYRDRQGFDQDLPAAGVLVYHVDEKLLLRPCRSCPRVYHVQLLEADGNEGLVRETANGGNRGEASDVFGPGVTRLSNATMPSTRLNSGAASSVTFHHVELVAGHAELEISTAEVALDRLVSPFLTSGELTVEEMQFLDRVGNKNGRYDVGDLRRYLAEHPTVRAAAEVATSP
jgi:M6 family metalloprotease-like protein